MSAKSKQKTENTAEQKHVVCSVYNNLNISQNNVNRKHDKPILENTDRT